MSNNEEEDILLRYLNLMDQRQDESDELQKDLSASLPHPPHQDTDDASTAPVSATALEAKFDDDRWLHVTSRPALHPTDNTAWPPVWPSRKKRPASPSTDQPASAQESEEESDPEWSEPDTDPGPSDTISKFAHEQYTTIITHHNHSSDPQGWVDDVLKQCQDYYEATITWKGLHKSLRMYRTKEAFDALTLSKRTEALTDLRHEVETLHLADPDTEMSVQVAACVAQKGGRGTVNEVRYGWSVLDALTEKIIQRPADGISTRGDLPGLKRAPESNTKKSGRTIPPKLYRKITCDVNQNIDFKTWLEEIVKESEDRFASAITWTSIGPNQRKRRVRDECERLLRDARSAAMTSLRTSAILYHGDHPSVKLSVEVAAVFHGKTSDKREARYDWRIRDVDTAEIVAEPPGEIASWTYLSERRPMQHRDGTAKRRRSSVLTQQIE